MRVLTVFLVLAVLAALVVVWVVRRPFPQVSGELKVPGLAAKVTVQRDKHGIPHIYADSSADLFFAQGYVHAQDRFFQMDMRRKMTAGRLSELLGAGLVETDKTIRTMGWRRTAEKELALLKPESRAYLDAYARGVNAWMKDHTGGAAALEYQVLGFINSSYQPEPWSPADSVTWLKAMAWNLTSNAPYEVERTLLSEKVPLEKVKELYPPYPYDRNKPLVDGGTVKNGVFDAEAVAKPQRDTKQPVTGGEAGAGALRRAAEAMDAVSKLAGRRGIGSNAWVVHGSLTASGKPLLANDPHLGGELPSVWYQAGLHCRTTSASCPFDTTGFTFSGMPGMIIGKNQRIAWGFTNMMPDIADVFLERVRPDNTYERAGKWLPLETRVEEIKVAGAAPVKLTVRSTPNGPLVSEALAPFGKMVPQAAKNLDPGGGHTYAAALRWTASEPGTSTDAVFALPAAQNWEQFRAAARLFEVPSQNLLYADVDGNIGYQAPGRIPIRSKGDGSMPVPGWTGEYTWKGYIPFEELPTVLNPKKGYLSSANHPVIGPQYPHLLGVDIAYGNRAQRISDRIEAATKYGKADLATMSSILADTHNALAPALVPHLLRLPAGGVAREARDLLKNWDHSDTRDSAAGAYFNVTWRHLVNRVFADELGRKVGGGDQYYEVVRGLLDKPSSPWWDDVTTRGVVEDRDTVLKAAAAGAVHELTGRLGDDPAAWKWGDLAQVELRHNPFGQSGIASLEWLFNQGTLPIGGSQDSVNVMFWDTTTDTYRVDALATMRMIVDLGDPDASRWINLTGNSGHATHPNYWDQAPLWATDQTIPMRSSPEAVRKDTADTLVLTP
ncbi:penicillin amidase [Sinosporangium siamense]|uniref:Penicillin amidase n=1 Tax=Sinosporangium siamense TaxID=1367973 RepID=A0A919RKU9_9ACTN|nr:penicillin amidase [Sinosporangium siamense]